VLALFGGLDGFIEFQRGMADERDLDAFMEDAP